MRCCETLRETFSSFSNCCHEVEETGLLTLADDKTLIIPVYIIGFSGPGFLYFFDFISAKWKSVESTRWWGFLHMFCTLIPIVVVSFYAYVQSLSGDYKEMMTAFVTIFIGIFHTARSAWGLAQLNAYCRWCESAFECVSSMQTAFETSGYESPVVHRKSLMVNNSLIDNDFSGMDINVSFGKNFKLKTKQPELCTIRWSVPFLSAYAHLLCDTNKMEQDMEEVIYSVNHALEYLMRVTVYIENEKSPLKTISLFSFIQKYRDLKNNGLKTGAYRSLIPAYNIFMDREVVSTSEAFKSDINNITSLYPVSDEEKHPSEPFQNRKLVSVPLVDAVLCAKELGLKTIKQLSECRRENQFPTPALERRAWKLLVSQSKKQLDKDDKAVENYAMIPKLPWKVFTIPLWRTDPNVRVLQASAHADLDFTVRFKRIGEKTRESLFFEASDIFETAQLWAQNQTYAFRTRISGCIIDTVRSILAKQIVRDLERNCNKAKYSFSNEGWTPKVSYSNTFRFKLSSYLVSEITIQNRIFLRQKRFVWECIVALRSNLVQESMKNLDIDFRSDCRAQMLMILSYPSLHFIGSTLDAQIQAFPCPQARIKGIQCTLHEGWATLELLMDPSCGSNIFQWQSWIDAAMGILQGFDTKQESNGINPINNRKIRRTSSCNSMVNIADIAENPDNFHSENMYIWRGWPASDPKLCQFEIDQWFDSWKETTDLNLQHDYQIEALVNKEIDKAEDAFRDLIGMV